MTASGSLFEGSLNGICGWVGIGLTRTQTNSALARMVEGLRIARADHYAVTGDMAALASVGSAGAASNAHFGKRARVVCAGSPRWNRRELDEIAAGEGAAAAIAHAYGLAGAESLQWLKGAFALAIQDLSDNSLLLAVDRTGICSLLYGRCGSGAIFASGAKSLNAHPLARRPVDLQSIFNYLFFHVVPSPRGIYQDVWRLLPGEYVRWCRGDLTKSFYWQPEYADDAPVSVDSLQAEFKELLRDSIGRVLQGEGKKGTFLSGGTDSSTVGGLMTEIQGSPADAYSIGFDAEGYDELKYARIAATHFGMRHHEYYLTPKDVVEAIPRLAQAYDEPFGNASVVASYYCARMAREDGVAYLLAGDGGDELFAGNSRYARQRTFDLYLNLPSIVRRSLEPVVFSVPGGGYIPLVGKMQSYIRQARIRLPDRLETYNFLNESPLDKILHPDFQAAIDPNEPARLMRESYNRAQAQSPLNRMLYLDLKQTLADNDLRKVTRSCELAGVRAVYPLLDDDIVELSTRIPAREKLKGFKLRYFFKAALKDFLPEEILKKKKHGFGVPCGIWIRTHEPLRELAYDSLASLKRRRFVRGEYIDWLTDQHERVHAAHYGVMLWVLLMLEQWLESENV